MPEIPKEQQEIIKKVAKEIGEKQDFAKHWDVWAELWQKDKDRFKSTCTSGKETKLDIKGLTRVIKEIRRQKALKEDNPIHWFQEPPKFKIPWRFEFHSKPRRTYNDIFPGFDEEKHVEKDPEDWIDGFCKHIEIEYLIERGK